MGHPQPPTVDPNQMSNVDSILRQQQDINHDPMAIAQPNSNSESTNPNLPMEDISKEQNIGMETRREEVKNEETAALTYMQEDHSHKYA